MSTVRRRVVAAVALAFLLGNAVGIVWLWYEGGNVTDVDDAAELVTSLARLTEFFAAYLALIQVLLLARIPWLDRLIGFDHLTVVHRWNGHATIALVVAHTLLSVWGYALLDDVSLWAEVETLLGAGVYPGMITATVGTALLMVVGLTSVAVARRRLPYELWHAIHLAAYAGIALAWFHQIPTGNELGAGRRRRELLACPVYRDARSRASCTGWACRSSTPSASGCAWPRWCRKARTSSPYTSPAGGSTGSARAPASSSSGASSHEAAGGRRIRSRCRRRRTDAHCA